MRVFMLSPNDIKVNERQRKMITEESIERLSESIKRLGQIEPIVVDKDKVLVAGERRLLACKKLGIEAMTIFKDDADDITLLEIELAENVEREELPWADKVEAVAKIDELKRKQHGESRGGQSPGWSLAKTGDLLNLSPSDVHRKVQIAAAMEQLPELRKAKTEDDAWKAIQKLKEQIITEELAKRTPKLTKAKLIHANCMDSKLGLPAVGDGVAGMVCTDPPFGIKLDEIKQKHSSSHESYKDISHDALMALLENVFTHSHRICKPDAYLYCFCAWENFNEVQDIMMGCNWDPCSKPLIWFATGEPGQCNVPARWPASVAECCVFARKGSPALTIQGRHNVLSYSRVHRKDKGASKFHPTQKPVALLKDLIERCAYPGMRVLDPFAGSGSTLLAAMELGLPSIGWEVDRNYYNAALVALSEAEKEVNNGKTSDSLARTD